ncbi:unnamed protein product [Umbelopsis ramanniana]
MSISIYCLALYFNVFSSAYQASNSSRRHLAGLHPDVDIGPGEKGHRVATIPKDLSPEQDKEEPAKVYGCTICLTHFLYRYELNNHYKNEHDLLALNVVEEDCLYANTTTNYALFQDSGK